MTIRKIFERIRNMINTNLDEYYRDKIRSGCAVLM